MSARPSRSATGHAALAGAGLVVVGLLIARMPADTPGRAYWPWLVLAGSIALVAVVVVWRSKRGGSAGLVGRWSRRDRRNDGVASRWAILRNASGFAMRRQAVILKPSLADLSRWRRFRTSPRAYATRIARAGVGASVWSPVEDVTVRLGGPRTGKTGEIAGRILDAPGAVVATSTRTDLIELTSPLRSLVGPVWVFNPTGLAELESTIVFDPLSGCEAPSTAATRAIDLLSGSAAPGGGGDREFWTAQARRVLASLLHAAALGGVGMRDVLTWLSNPEHARQEILEYLRRSVEPSFEFDALQFLDTPERTQSSIVTTIMPSLGWLSDATAAAAAGVDREGGVPSFDVQELLDDKGTVYMLGAEEAQTAPLVAALTGHIAREARRIAGRMDKGRLDPSLTLALDEAALICPIPLDNWTSDMGGRNITIHIGAQSRAQLRAKWGDTGAAAILNNAATILIFGGTRDEGDLQAFSTLIGTREEVTKTYDAGGAVTSSTTRDVPVLSPAQIAQLPKRHVVIVRRGMAPAVGTVQMAWRRHDVRRNLRRARREGTRQRRADARRAAAGWIGARIERIPGLSERLGRTTTRIPLTRQKESTDA